MPNCNKKSRVRRTAAAAETASRHGKVHESPFDCVACTMNSSETTLPTMPLLPLGCFAAISTPCSHERDELTAAVASTLLATANKRTVSGEGGAVAKDKPVAEAQAQCQMPAIPSSHQKNLRV